MPRQENHRLYVLKFITAPPSPPCNARRALRIEKPKWDPRNTVRAGGGIVRGGTDGWRNAVRYQYSTVRDAGEGEARGTEQMKTIRLFGEKRLVKNEYENVQG